jgi:hypothetical protein
VLIADVSGRPLTAGVVNDLVEDLVTWRREGYVPAAHQRVFGVQMEVSQLVDPPRSLLPGRRPASERERKADADTRINRVTGCGAELDRIGATASADRRHIPAEMLTAADRRPASDTIGALARMCIRSASMLSSAARKSWGAGNRVSGGWTLRCLPPGTLARGSPNRVTCWSR